MLYTTHLINVLSIYPPPPLYTDSNTYIKNTTRYNGNTNLIEAPIERIVVSVAWYRYIGGQKLDQTSIKLLISIKSAL